LKYRWIVPSCIVRPNFGMVTSTGIRVSLRRERAVGYKKRGFPG
jgi:hypothetical protein